MIPITFDTLKMFVSSLYSLDILSRVFPLLLINKFTSFLVVTEDNMWDRLCYSFNGFFQFRINLGVAIRDSNFDNFDNVLLPFLEECYSVQNGKKYTLVFDEEQKKKFIDVCNSFKGKLWDDIINEFCDELLVLAKSSTVNGRYLYGEG